ncbi:MAG: hypothetical protein WBP85_04400 [Terracidiphilus sp.]
MHSRFALVSGLLTLCFLVPSPVHAQRLYPIQGPAAAQTPPPSFTAKLTKYLGTSGQVTLTRAGEIFQGTWNTVTLTFANFKTAGDPSGFPPQPNLAFAWDLVYGQGYFLAHILGSQSIGQATATDGNGTVLQIEFQKQRLGDPVDNIFGVAVDNKGNIYKVVL